MLSPCLLMLLSAGTPDAGPSPAWLKGVTFHDVAIQKVKDEELEMATIASIYFPKPGSLAAGDAMEFDRCTFTAVPEKDLFLLERKCENSPQPMKATWKWLGPERAVTTLLYSTPTEVAVLHPSPEQRRESYGERLAARTLSAGSYVGADAGGVFQLLADGGVRWGKGPVPARFFTCMSECGEGAVEQLCLFSKSTGRTSVFQKTDAGMVGFAGESTGLCNGPAVLQAQKQLPPTVTRARK